MNEEQKAFTAYLIKVLNPKDAADFENKVAQLSENELKEFYKQYKAMEGNQISMAKLGAKLSYVQTLRGECPEGYEVEKYMAGGCVKCKKKAEGAKVVDIFKDKCGGKAKKRVKKDQKGAVVNKADTVHTNKGVYNVSNKKLPYKKMTPADYRKLSDRDKVKVDMKDQANGRGAGGAGAVKNKGIGKNYFGGTVQRRIIKQ
jgi:hypothetical protein|nr:MAG TPA: hypothetical protein [Caudoviricetes sp.]